jgi:hypothetical protein
MKTYGQRRSQLQEKSIARSRGGRVQKASGAGKLAKGDVRVVGEIRTEAKTTSKRSYRLKFSDVVKIRSEAITLGFEDWDMQIEFQGQAGRGTKVAVVDLPTASLLLKDQSVRSLSIPVDDASIVLQESAMLELTAKSQLIGLFPSKFPALKRGIAIVPWDLYERARVAQRSENV